MLQPVEQTSDIKIGYIPGVSTIKIFGTAYSFCAHLTSKEFALGYFDGKQIILVMKNCMMNIAGLICGLSLIMD